MWNSYLSSRAMVSMYLTLFLLVLQGALSQMTKQEEYWHEEIEKSLKANIKGQCKWEDIPGFSAPSNDSDTFFVFKLFPTKNDLNSLKNLPLSLSKANSQLIDVANLANFYNDSFDTSLQWQIPDDHPAQNRWLCYNLTKLASKERILDLYQSFRTPERAFYVLRNSRAVITPAGSVGFNCGYYQAKEGCETRWDRNQDRWYKGCTALLQSNNVDWQTPWDEENQEKRRLSVEIIKNCTTKWEIYEYKLNMTTEHLFHPKFYKRVFILENQWDYNYHHFTADCLARLARNLKFLRANPDVMIHIRSMEEYDTPPINRSKKFKAAAKGFRNRLFALLGIDPERIIWDIALADEVYIPRALHCAFAASNPVEIRALAKELNHAAITELPVHVRSKVLSQYKNPHIKKNLIIQQRYTAFGSSERYWNNQTTKELADELTLLFPNHNVMIISSESASKPDFCLSCEIRDYQNADILVGNHGAGLTSAMFMPPGAMIFEIVAKFANVNMPVCGYYGPWSSMFGHHHYLYAYRYELHEPLRMENVAAQALKFYQEIHFKRREDLNITSFLYHDKAVVDVENGVITSPFLPW